MSHDDDVMPDALAGLAASAALALSDIPFATLISEARVGRIDGKFIINPSRTIRIIRHRYDDWSFYGFYRNGRR
jgi:polyribonucleotide nucleotidyltransferase